MPDDDVVTFEPHEQVILAVIHRRALDEVAAATLQDEVGAAAAASPNLPIVLDMSKVKFVPSVALGALAHLQKALGISGQKVILVGITRQVRGTLSVTRLDKVLEIRHSLDDALRHL